MKQLFFFHNPKAAGTSLMELLTAFYPPSRVCQGPLIENTEVEHARNNGRYAPFRGYDLYAGHYGLDIFLSVCEGHLPVTAFRHPADRLFSLYRYFRAVDVPIDELGEELKPVKLAKECNFSEFALSNYPPLRIHNENHHFRQLSNSGWDLAINQSVSDVVAFIDVMPWFLVVEDMESSMRWAHESFGWEPSAMPMSNKGSRPTQQERDELAALRNEITQRNALDYEIYLHAVERLRSVVRRHKIAVC